MIGAGGTAGHVVPALAVADALRADGAEVQFIGGHRAEATLVPEAGYPLHQIDVVSLPRGRPLAALGAAATDTAALRRCLRLVAEIAPDVVLGGGGYVAGPVGLAARLRRIPLVLTEIDSHLGLTNRLLSPVARRVCLALPIAGREVGSRYIVTGRPVPPLVTDRNSARARFGIGSGETLVVIFGGSLGARSINFAAVEAFAGAGGVGDTGAQVRILHAAGERDLPDLQAILDAADAIPHYDLRGYISGFMDALVAADLVVARSGGSIFEIALAGKPSILVPYPHATADHQTTNARYLADAGAAVIIPDAELTAPRLASEVGRLLADPGRLAAMGRAALGLARPEAAGEIAAEVLAAAGTVIRRRPRGRRREGSQ